MVGSVLSSSIPAHMLPLADIGGDLDGALLTDSNSQLFEVKQKDAKKKTWTKKFVIDDQMASLLKKYLSLLFRLCSLF